MNVLQLNASIHGDAAESTRLADQLVAGLREREGVAQQLTRRNLAVDPLPHLDADRFAAFTTPAARRTPAQAEAAALSDSLIGELRAADVLVLGLPMYNFGVPTQLKAWFDQVARAGITFKYTDQGPVGLMTGKRAYVIATRGGVYAGTPRDTQSAYVRDFLAFLGITEVEFVFAEGTAMGPDARRAALDGARERVAGLTARLPLAA